MSDEEVYFDADEEEQNHEDAAEEDAMEEDVLDTPEKIFDKATNSLGIDDYYAIDLFYKVYLDDNTTEKMRAESITNISLTISQYPEDIERILNVLSDVFEAYKTYNTLNDTDLSNIIRGMMNNLSNYEDTFFQFLECVKPEVTVEFNPLLYAELKICEFDFMVKSGQIENINLDEIEPLIDISSSSTLMAKQDYVKLLVLKMDIADFQHDEDEMIKLYEEEKKIPQYNTTIYQNALFAKIDGIILKNSRKFFEAKNKFLEAFNLFDDIGNDKRIDCIKYSLLCEMSNHETISIFNIPRVKPYQNEGCLETLANMENAYLRSNITDFDQCFNEVSELFYNKETDINFLNEVRNYVLRGSILKLIRNYKSVDIEFVANKFSSDKAEVKELILDLILSRDLDAVLDRESGTVDVLEQIKPSKYLNGTNAILNSIEFCISSISNDVKLDY